VNERIARLNEVARAQSAAFRESFLGEEVEVLVENASGEEQEESPLAGYQHGRCERYFAVHFESQGEVLEAGALVRLRVERVMGERTFGAVVKDAMIAVIQRVTQASVKVEGRIWRCR